MTCLEAGLQRRAAPRDFALLRHPRFAPFAPWQARVRLCGDELLLLLRRRGFEVLESHSQPCSYTEDPLSILRQEFLSLFFVARKRAPLKT